MIDQPLFRVNDAFHQMPPFIKMSASSLAHTDPPAHPHTPCTPTVVRSSPASVNMHTSNYRADICPGCCSLDQHLRTGMAASLWSVCSHSVLSTSEGWFVCKRRSCWHSIHWCGLSWFWFRAKTMMLMWKSQPHADKMKSTSFNCC